ncbi:hypothetical protein P168DRAFT_341871 [Aspergillus campestris IBT 28561]|uniref:Uncharacterized protein n=1 Tax=Aspergillus campestris (strain IBT 28561) TaxID=1392248 RepID=A0A2I1CQ00_ASPC2|nr:uncharacterized protein P168DRAFT_341871 [Aspergillus campestris IBT 28561]PKX99698.1 hypothetical protein P168DRAFT_341871 [Aspergillus campestris IBT 28561]
MFHRYRHVGLGGGVGIVDGGSVGSERRSRCRCSGRRSSCPGPPYRRSGATMAETSKRTSPSCRCCQSRLTPGGRELALPSVGTLPGRTSSVVSGWKATYLSPPGLTVSVRAWWPKKPSICPLGPYLFQNTRLQLSVRSPEISATYCHWSASPWRSR